MPVQAKAIPYVLEGRDLMVQSRTGSGKTGAFVLPILQRVRIDDAVCQALVLVPTRELARQVVEDAEQLQTAIDKTRTAEQDLHAVVTALENLKRERSPETA